MANKQKFYTVWAGKQPGVYASWSECQAQVTGQKGAKYKSYPTREAAVAALAAGVPQDYYKPHPTASALQNPPEYRNDTVLPLPKDVVADAIAVDAACSKNPGPMEYRGIDLRTGAEVFHFGPILGTNNIGEFLAIVHCLAWLKKQGNSHTAIYSDSRNAMLWVKKKECKTKLAASPKTEQALQLVERALTWLRSNTYTTSLLKWETNRWGEIPADFGRK